MVVVVVVVVVVVAVKVVLVGVGCYNALHKRRQAQALFRFAVARLCTHNDDDDEHYTMSKIFGKALSPALREIRFLLSQNGQASSGAR